jgi:hypothetical protein
MGYNHPEILKSSPYYDDFDDTKNFLRILFKPGYAVQARELTQLQTLLQNQISKFGSHIFKSGSQIFGGGVNLGTANFIRARITFAATGVVTSSADLIGKVLTIGSNQTLARAKIVDVLSPIASTDPNYTIILQYLTGNTFAVGAELTFDGTITATTITIPSTSITNIPSSDNIGVCQTLSVDSGIFYTDGFFVNNTAQTTTLHVLQDGVRKFRDLILTSEGVTNRIGFEVVRTAITSEIDSTLTDPARGFYNYSAPGADRYVIDLQLTTQEFDPTSVEPGEFTTEDFVELARVVNGVLDYVKKVPTYAELEDTLARRTYDESGNYTTKPFELEVKNHYRNDIYALAIKVDSGFTQEMYAGDYIVTKFNGVNTKVGKIVRFEKYIPTSDEVNSTEQSDLPTTTVYVERKKNDNDILDYPFFSTSTTDNQNIIYYLNVERTTEKLLGITKQVVASRDPDGVYSPEEGGDDEKYVLSVKPGKAYVFGYEFETINNTNIIVDKDRSESIVSLDDYNLGANVGNYFLVEAPFNTWNTEIDLEDMPYFKFGGRYIRLTIPQQEEIKRSQFLKYWSPLPSDQDQTTYRSVVFVTTVEALATESLVGHTNPSSPDYLHLIDSSVEEGGTELEIANDAGFIRPQNTDIAISKYAGGGTSLASYPIVNMSNAPESNITRMVFTDPWHGNVTVAYDITSESATNNANTYIAETENLFNIKQIKCLDTAVPTSIQVTTGIGLRWIPASATGVGLASGSTLYTKVIRSISWTGGTNTENAHFNLDDGVVFTDPATSTSPISYGTSIAYVIRESNTKRHIIKPNGSLGCNGGGAVDCTDEGQGGFFAVGDIVTQNYIINGQEVQAVGEVLAVGGDFSLPTEGNSGVEVFIQSSGVYSFYGVNDEDISTQGVTELGCIIGPCGVYKPRSSISLNNPTCGELIRIGFKDSEDVGGYAVNGTVFQYNYIALQEDINEVPSYLASDLVRGKVVSWNETSKELIVLETQGRFEKSNGTIYQLASGTDGQVKYGGRGWDKAKTKHSADTDNGAGISIYDIEKVSGIFIDLNGTVNKNFLETSISVFDYTPARQGESIVQIAIPSSDNYTGQAFSAGQLIYQNRGTDGVARGILLSFTHKDLTNPADVSDTVLIIQPTDIVEFIVGATANPILVTNNSSLSLPVTAFNATKTKEIIGCGRLRILRRQEETAYQAFFFDIKMDYLPDLSRKYNLNEVSTFYYETDFASSIVNNYEDDDIQLVTANEDDYIFAVHPSEGIDLSTTTDNFTFSKVFDPELNNLLFMLPGSSSIKSVGEMDYRIQQQLSYAGDFSTQAITFNTLDSYVRFIGGESSLVGKVDSNDLIEHYTLFVNGVVVDLTDSLYTTTTNNYGSPTSNATVTITKTGPTWQTSQVTSVQLITNLNVNPKPANTGIRTKQQKRQTETVTLKKTKDGLWKANLTKADIISIDKITTAGSSTDIKSEFDLFTGQTDNLYDFGQVTLKNEYLVENVPEYTEIIISYQYFSHKGVGPITINSYIDSVDYKDIPYYTSTATGKVYKLDSVVDMRPVIELVNGKGVITKKWIPAPAASFDVDYEYYLSKAHKLVITRDLKFKLISGRPAFEAELPSDDENAMTLYNILTEPYVFDRSDVVASMVNNRRYTMKDIIGLDNRIEKLEQYTILNSLEMKALSEQIIDVNTQLDRVRTAVLVDNFSTHATGDTVNTQYNISIDSEENTIRPPFTMNLITLNETNPVLDNLVKTSDNVVLLPYDEINLISQYASSGVEKINPFNDISWIGTVKLSPSSDAWFDTQVVPDIRENNNGVNDAIVTTVPSVENYQNTSFGKNYRFWKRSWFGKTDNSTSVGNVQRKRNTKYARQAIRDVHFNKRTNPAETTTSNTVNVGQNKVVDRSVMPFIRPKTITATAEGLRPYTTVYVFFDDVDISSECTILNNVGGRVGGVLLTNRYGSINFSFNIKSRTFKAGEKILVITDSPSNSSALASTVAETTYNVSGAIQTSESNYVSTRKARKNPSRYSKNVSDPVAQTFFVDPLVYPQGLFVSSVDLFFAEKDGSLPVTVELRPTSSGYPASRDSTLVYPFASVTKYSEDIVITNTPNLNNATAQGISVAINSTVEDTRTRFTFSTPVHLLPGEHCLVVKTNSSDYLLYVAEIGQNLLNATGRIAQQAAIGSFFKSQNAGKWQAYENIDLMFAINRCEFSGSTGLSGSITLNDVVSATTPDHLFETLTVNNDEIKFNNTDITYTIRTVNATGSVLQANSIPITVNNNINLSTASKVTYNGESIELGISLTSTDTYISPMFDLDRLAVIAIHNIVENNTSTSKTNLNYNGELEPTTPINSTETARSRYITKIVELEQGFESTNIKVSMGANLPAGTKMQVFLKQQSMGKDSRFDEEPYIQLVSSKPTYVSPDENTYEDLFFTIPTDLEQAFSKFAVKICLFSDNPVRIPKVKELRVVSLV